MSAQMFYVHEAISQTQNGQHTFCPKNNNTYSVVTLQWEPWPVTK